MGVFGDLWTCNHVIDTTSKNISDSQLSKSNPINILPIIITNIVSKTISFDNSNVSG